VTALAAEFAVILLHDPKQPIGIDRDSRDWQERLLLTEFFDTSSRLLAQVFFTGKSQLFQRSGAEEV